MLAYNFSLVFSLLLWVIKTNLREDEKEISGYFSTQKALPEGLCLYSRELQCCHASSPADSAAAENPATAGTGSWGVPGATERKRLQGHRWCSTQRHRRSPTGCYHLSLINLHLKKKKKSKQQPGVEGAVSAVAPPASPQMVVPGDFQLGQSDL